jgi:hypothetical protein
MFPAQADHQRRLDDRVLPPVDIDPVPEGSLVHAELTVNLSDRPRAVDHHLHRFVAVLRRKALLYLDRPGGSGEADLPETITLGCGWISGWMIGVDGDPIA